MASTRQSGSVTRRQLLRIVASAGSTLVLGPLALACSPQVPPPAPPGAAPAPANTQAAAQPAAPAPTAPPKAGGTLVVALSSDPGLPLDPHETPDSSTRRLYTLFHDTLIVQAPGSFKLMPGLAEKWSASPDGKSYTFNLRKGVKFHDGTPFTAAAMKFSIDRQINPDNPFNKLGKFVQGKNRLGDIKAVSVVDEFTLRIELKRVLAPFLENLATYVGAVLSPVAVEKAGAKYGDRPVGTGPFRFVSFEPGVRLVIERNPDYWGTPPPIDRAILIPIVEQQARAAALQSGMVDLIMEPSAEVVADMRSKPGFRLIELKGPHIWYITMSTRKKPFDDVRVRQAMNFAVDKQTIIRDILRGTGVVAEGPLNPAAFGDWAETDTQKYPYDPAKAKALLAEAGYPNGFETTIRFPESGVGTQSPAAMCTMIQAQLAQVGVKAKLESYESVAYHNKVYNPGDFEMGTRYWNTVMGDPDNVLYSNFHSSRQPPNYYNAGFYKNAEVDRLLDEAQVTIDEAKRKQLYRQAQKIIVAETPWLLVDHEITYAISNDKVTGFQLHPSTNIFLDAVRVNK